MALVVFNGVQYDDRRLPAHVDPKGCVPLDEWRTANRRVRTRPRMGAKTPASRPAAPAEKPDEKPAVEPEDTAPAKRPRKG